MHFVELPKWKKYYASLDSEMRKGFKHLEKWLTYFSKDTTDNELEEMAMEMPAMNVALQAERAFMLDPTKRILYDQKEKVRRDRAARESYLLKTGAEKGQNEVILKLLKKEKSVDEIADLLDFSKERVIAVAKANNY